MHVDSAEVYRWRRPSTMRWCSMVRTNAQLNEPVLSKALTRFTFPWSWDGKNAVLQSRCVDETGYVQPTREQPIAMRGLHPGPDGFNHYNGIKQWFVRE